MTGQAVIGIDIGGTSIKGIIAGSGGISLGRLERVTPVGDAGAIVDTIVHMINTLRQDAGVAGSVAAIGLVMPGVVDRRGGVARYSANIGWHNLPIQRLVSDRVGLPVTIDHDVRAATVAEVRNGAALGMRDVLFVAIGTGIAVGTVAGGRVLEGAAGLAGEAGHMPVVIDGEQCPCGQRGCAEAYASGAALARRYAARTGYASVPAEEVIARAVHGDPTAAAVLDEAVSALTRMVLVCVLISDPGVIVLAGGVSAAGAAIIDPMRRGLAAGMLWRTPPPIRVSAFGRDAGLRGALLLAQSHDTSPSVADFGKDLLEDD